MTPCPPPPPPVSELTAHQNAIVAWDEKHGYYPLPAGIPPPPGHVSTPLPPQPVPVGSNAGVRPSLSDPVCQAIVKRKINARSKGQRGEREIVDLLQAVVDAERPRYQLSPIVLQRNALQAHLGGCDLHGLDGFSVEVKFQETDYNPAWWAQTLRQAGTTAVPILFYRRSRQAWTVKFQAYVCTPGDRDQIGMDMTVNLADFMRWFVDAYNEACEREARAKVGTMGHLLVEHSPC